MSDLASSWPRAIAVLCLCLIFGLQPAHAQPARTPRQLIDHLGVDIRRILDDPKSTATPEDAERAVADRITALIASSPGHLSLTELDDHGRTPLMLAASGGYAAVVKALLTDPSVRLAINVPDKDGETAWMLANFAPTVTLVACQPGALTAERYPLLPPYIRRLAHLLKAKADPIVSIIRDIEAAGAEVTPQEAKRAWLERCPNTSPELRKALAEGELLPALIEDSLARQREFNKIAKESPRSVPLMPPPEMKFIHSKGGKSAGRESPLLQVSEMRCDRMVKPEMPTLNWSGEIMFKVVVTTRAGVVESVDFTPLAGTKEKRFVDFFRSVIVRALAQYQCDGDHVFEQEFQIRYS